MKIAFIGGGNMASALIGGLIKRGVASENIYAIDTNERALAQLVKNFHQIRTSDTLSAALDKYEVLVLAVKPQSLKEVAHQLAPYLHTQLVISIAAGVRIADLSRWLGGYSHIVRTMPNTPALIGKGVTGAFALHLSPMAHSLAQQVLAAAGTVIWCDDEKQIDAISAISGSGPAYVFYLIEALETAAKQLGFNDEQGRTLALQTFSGAVQLAQEADESPQQLRERVTSKGGTTAVALASFEQDKIKEAIVRGALAANARAQEMGNEFGQL